MSTEPTSQELVRELRADGLSVAEIATAMNRSPAMIRHVETGRKPGNNMRESLTELRERGEVTAPPPRRLRADGTPARVRRSAAAIEAERRAQAAARGNVANQTGKGVASAAMSSGPPPDPAPRPRAGRFGAATLHLGGGGKRHEISAPPTERLGSRDQARQTLLGALRSTARGQAHGKKHVMITAYTQSGKKQVIGSKGGYQASTILRGMKKGNDVYATLGEELNKAAPGNTSGGASGAEDKRSESSEIDHSKDPIVHVEITTW